MWAKRADRNQPELVKQLRQIPGLTVAHTHMIGKGFPDLVVAFGGRNFLFEVKDPDQPPSKRQLTPDEAEWHEGWTGQVAVVETIEDVLKVINTV